MDPTTNRINLCSGGGSEQFILEMDTSDTTDPSGPVYAEGIDYNSNGDIFVVGYSNAARVSGDVSTVCKVNKTGTAVEWSKEYDKNGHTDYFSVVRCNRDESGEPIYVGGTSGNYVTHSTGSHADAVLKKFADNGTTLWEVEWGNTAYDAFRCIEFDSSGSNFYCTGTAYPWQSGIAASKFNTSGAHQTGRKVEMATTESSHNITVDNSDDVWWGGIDNNTSSSSWVGHYNSSLNRQNSWKFSAGSTLLYGLDADASGNVYVMVDNNNSWSGTSGTISGNSGTILQMNANGNWTWALTSGGSSGANYGYGLACDKTVSQGDVYGMSHASTVLTGTSHTGIYVIKRGYSGSTIWSRMFTKSNGYVTFSGGNQSIRCDGEFLYICGTHQSGSVVRPFVIKYPVDGSATGTYGDWVITAMTDGQNNYRAHDNNFLSSWSFWGGGEYNVTYDQTSQTVEDVEATGTATLGNKENL